MMCGSGVFHNKDGTPNIARTTESVVMPNSTLILVEGKEVSVPSLAQKQNLDLDPTEITLQNR